MNDLVILVVAFLLGGVLGVFYFGGLWLTVKRVPYSKHPKIMMLASFMVRVSALVAAFYVLNRNDWRKWALALLGFMVIRAISLRITQQGAVGERV